ncbi:hypothetical protein NQ318_015840 [Aromia moschata]|uniref:Uncharacterized protein n=1 Tax=Aromia moschata TaxID=1265417 RepID=A0AAV8YPI7_9CUCU|nr:hypothetical protein NQ318_015840 [Aromia moschata]
MLQDGLTCVQDENFTTTTPYTVTFSDITTEQIDYIPESTTNKSYPTNTVSESSDNGMVAGITIVISLILMTVVGLVMYSLYRHLMHRNMTSMNFDNPVYRKTTEDQFSLEKNQFQPPTRPYLSTVGEEAQQPLTSANINDPV